MKINKKNKIPNTIVIISMSLMLTNNFAFAESTNDIKQQINNNATAQATAKNEIETLDTQIDTILFQISSLDNKIANNQASIEKTEADLLVEKGYLKEYMRTMYIDGQTSTIELIMTSKNFSDFIDKSEYISTMQKNVKTATDNIAKTKYNLEKAKHNLEIEQQQQVSLKVGLEQQKSQKDSYLNQLTSQEKNLRDKLAEMMSSGTVSCGGRAKAGNMMFAMPLDCGFVSQGYGNTEYATKDKAYNGAIHNGVDIAVGANTAIHPIGNGVVYATGTSPSGGWGNWIMVDHQNGYYSLYAHMISPAFFSKGDKVTTEDTLGGVGGTPYWPVHLHLSLYKGVPSGWRDNEVGSYTEGTVDPFDYMQITISTKGTDWDSSHSH